MVGTSQWAKVQRVLRFINRLSIVSWLQLLSLFLNKKFRVYTFNLSISIYLHIRINK